MDVLILGAMAVVLIAITLWLVVWPARATDSVDGAVRDKEAPGMTPQGDQFEDQYTSATADLSAGGVATSRTASSEHVVEAPSPTAYQTAGEPWSEPTVARAGVDYGAFEAARLAPKPQGTVEPTGEARRRTIGIGAVALLTLGGAVGGAWLYARWQHQRQKPINRIKRRLIR
jgi:hypothetical protein